MRRRICGVVAAVALGLSLHVGAADAGAATTIGSDLAGAGDGNVACGLGCTLGLRSIGGGQEITAPADGVVVRWRVKLGAGTDAQLMRLRVLRGTGASSTAIASGATESVPAGAGSYVFQTQLPIRAGDYIGVDCCQGGDAFVLRNPGGSGTLDAWSPPLGDGEQRVPSVSAPFELLINADIEPDCDGDGSGDETQDPELPFSEACGKGNRSLTLDANKNKVKEGKKVRLSGRIAGAARQGPCETGQTVELQRKRPKQTTFTTFAQVQTDAQGNFSLKKKVKKTFEFRAQVVETAACTPALSNSEKVRVKKRR
jgi:hypothetical protein